MARPLDLRRARLRPSLDLDQSQLLFTLLAHRYTKGALIVTSNLEFADWKTAFAGDERLTAALLGSTLCAILARSQHDARARGQA